MKEKTILFFLKGVALLPLWILYIFADFIYFVVYRIIGYRKKVVRENLLSSFPEKGEKEIKKIERGYYHFLADVIVETVKLFHISDKQLRRRIKVNNYEAINADLSDGKNVVLLLGHYGNWEWVQEISRYFIPEAYMGSIYHPLNNKTWDNIYLKLRSRWGTHIVAQKQAVRTLLNRDHFPWVFGFIADARPLTFTPRNCIEFLNHPTYFIYGPEEIGSKLGARFYYLEMLPQRRGHYEITFRPLVPSDSAKTEAERIQTSNDLPRSSAEETYPVTREFWREFGSTIQKAPSYWLWSHKRWKKPPTSD